MEHKHSSEDFDRGYSECKHCDKYLHLLQAGSDCETWIQCKKCNCWVVEKSEYFGCNCSSK